MAGLLNDIMADDGAAFTDLDGFGEAVVYTPRGGTPRTINAVVDRNPEVDAVIVIEVRNHATLGIQPSDTGLIGGTIAVPIKLGQTASTFVIEQPNPMEQDAGILRIALNAIKGDVR